MNEVQMNRRELLLNASYLGGALVLASCTGSSGSTDKPSGSPFNPAAGLPEIEGGEVVLDPMKFPTKFQESPDFAKQVAAGRLPKVTDRIGQDPLVIKPVHEIGKYGGTIRRGFIGTEDLQNANLFCAGPDNLLYWDFRHETVVPNIARSFEMSEDLTELTLSLRRGMKWSDGHPFTADDIVFWRDDINLNPEIGPGSSSLRVRFQNVVVEKVDDYTVLFRSPVPYAALPEFLAGLTDIGGQSFGGSAGGGGFAPKHYLSQFHPKYTSESAANALAKKAGFDGWTSHLLNRNSWFLNKDLPTVTPWVVTRPVNEPPWEFTANPYSIWVDTEGNQLPYIPTIKMSYSQDSQVVALRAVAGEYDFMDRGLQVASMPVLIKNQKRSGYTIRRAPDQVMDAVVQLNLSYDKDPEIGDLIRTVEFRRALSLGLDRHQINETFFLGTGQESATIAPEGTDYYPGAEWRTKWATHDIAEANKLLDDLGLDKKDGKGYRLRPSGRRRLSLEITSSASKIDFPAVGEMIRRQWKQIGIEATNETVDSTLLVELTAANKLMLSVNSILGTEAPFLGPYGLLPAVATGASGMMGVPYIQWFLSDGKTGTKPPESLAPLKDAMALFRQGLEVPGPERAEIGKQISQLHADQVWTIGLVGFGLATYGLYYAKDSLGNVPARFMNNSQLKNPTITLPMTFYYR